MYKSFKKSDSKKLIKLINKLTGDSSIILHLKSMPDECFTNPSLIMYIFANHGPDILDKQLVTVWKKIVKMYYDIESDCALDFYDLSMLFLKNHTFPDDLPEKMKQLRSVTIGDTKGSVHQTLKAYLTQCNMFNMEDVLKLLNRQKNGLRFSGSHYHLASEIESAFEDATYETMALYSRFLSEMSSCAAYLAIDELQNSKLEKSRLVLLKKLIELDFFSDKTIHSLFSASGSLQYKIFMNLNRILNSDEALSIIGQSENIFMEAIQSKSINVFLIQYLIQDVGIDGNKFPYLIGEGCNIIPELFHQLLRFVVSLRSRDLLTSKILSGFENVLREHLGREAKLFSNIKLLYDSLPVNQFSEEVIADYLVLISGLVSKYPDYFDQSPLVYYIRVVLSGQQNSFGMSAIDIARYLGSIGNVVLPDGVDKKKLRKRFAPVYIAGEDDPIANTEVEWREFLYGLSNNTISASMTVHEKKEAVSSKLNKNINDSQSVHHASVHASVSESAKKIMSIYQNSEYLVHTDKSLVAIKQLILSSHDKTKQSAAALRYVDEFIEGKVYDYKDTVSGVLLSEALACFYCTIHDEKLRCVSYGESLKSLIEGLYEIQRGYNLDDKGFDAFDTKDSRVCPSGSFNKIFEKLSVIHKCCHLEFVTKNTATKKMSIVIRETVKSYLAQRCEELGLLSKPYKSILEKIESEECVAPIWSDIRSIVADIIFKEFGPFLFKGGKESDDFKDFINAGEYMAYDVKNELRLVKKAQQNPGGRLCTVFSTAAASSNATPAGQRVSSPSSQSNSSSETKGYASEKNYYQQNYNGP